MLAGNRRSTGFNSLLPNFYVRRQVDGVGDYLGDYDNLVAMPKRKETDKVTFIAEYRDGSVARFDIDPWTLRNGHWVARIIARERQEQGSLKPGEIVRMYPDRRR